MAGCAQRYLLLTIILFTLSLSMHTFAQTTTLLDVAALQALYAALNSPTTLSNWTGDPCVAQWVGVTCVAGGSEFFVSGLTLGTMGLTGTLPAELGSMHNLSFLRASNNQLSGPLPPLLGTNGLLTVLDLSSNLIAGNLSQGLTNNFSIISLANNTLVNGWPTQLPLHNLTHLDLSGNRLAGPLPPTLGTAQTLSVLRLSRNGWDGAIPGELGTLPQLTELWLDTNAFSGEVPASLQNLSRLASLTLFSNRLTGLLPSGLAKFRDKAYNNSGLCLDATSACHLSLPAPCNGTAVGICYCSAGVQGSQTCTPEGVFAPCSCGSYRIPGNSGRGQRGISRSTLALIVVGAVVGTLLLVFLFAILAVRYVNVKRGGSGWDCSKAYIKTPVSAEPPPAPIPPPPVFSLDGKAPRGPNPPTVPRRLTAMAKARSWGRTHSMAHSKGDVDMEEEVETWSGGAEEGGVRRFTFEAIRRATDNFDAENVVGADGACRVYRAVMPDGSVGAVKELEFAGNGLGTLGEFEDAVAVVGRAVHRNLVQVVGLCAEEDSRLVVMEFVPNGSLESHLHGVETEAVLEWNTRMHIALGAAEGLEFLHDMDPPLVHAEVRSSNVLLTAEGDAKLGDYSLALLTGRSAGGGSSANSNMALAAGCAAPELAYSVEYSCETDVYSFGVLLLEVITGRRPLDPKRPPIEQALVRWARPRLTERNRVEGLVDWKVGGLYSSPALYQLALLAWQCIQVDPKSRPHMTQVVEVLQKVQNLPLDAGGGMDPNAQEEQRLHDFLSVTRAEEEEEGLNRSMQMSERDQHPLSRSSSGGGSSEARIPLRPAASQHGRALGGGSPV